MEYPTCQVYNAQSLALFHSVGWQTVQNKRGQRESETESRGFCRTPLISLFLWKHQLSQLASKQVDLQSRSKVVETLEQDHVSSIPLINIEKCSVFPTKKGKIKWLYINIVSWGRGNSLGIPTFLSGIVKSVWYLVSIDKNTAPDFGYSKRSEAG